MIFTTLLLGINIVVMGLFTLLFVQGPFSSFEQEVWYRYGSIGFFLIGAAIPLCAVIFARSYVRRHSLATNITLSATTITYLGYLLFSGGGV